MDTVCENCNQLAELHTVEHLGHVIHAFLPASFCDMYFYIEGRQKSWR